MCAVARVQSNLCLFLGKNIFNFTSNGISIKRLHYVKCSRARFIQINNAKCVYFAQLPTLLILPKPPRHLFSLNGIPMGRLYAKWKSFRIVCRVLQMRSMKSKPENWYHTNIDELNQVMNSDVEVLRYFVYRTWHTHICMQHTRYDVVRYFPCKMYRLTFGRLKISYIDRTGAAESCLNAPD